MLNTQYKEKRAAKAALTFECSYHYIDDLAFSIFTLITWMEFLSS